MDFSQPEMPPAALQPFRYSSSTAMSAGDTPDTREARPTVSGRSAVSFCTASVRRPRICV